MLDDVKSWNISFCWHREGQWRKEQDTDPRPDPHPIPDPLARGMDPRIWIHIKMSRMHNTEKNSWCAMCERNSWKIQLGKCECMYCSVCVSECV